MVRAAVSKILLLTGVAVTIALAFFSVRKDTSAPLASKDSPALCRDDLKSEQSEKEKTVFVSCAGFF